MTWVPATFSCDDDQLVAIVHDGHVGARRGVLIIVGGPQYRVGSHRQFVQLSRVLDEAGVPSMRFDYRGMGDSDGEPRDFEDIDLDIAAAIEAFRRHCPGLEQIVIWGLCDAASAALMYAHSDSRVAGLVLLNPWVRSEQSLARSYVRVYYAKRVLSRDFWKKFASGGVNVLSSLSSFMKTLVASAQQNEELVSQDFRARMLDGMKRFGGRTLFILSGNDLTAGEFKEHTAADPIWRTLMGRKEVAVHEIPAANHTFSASPWRDEVAEATLEWLRKW